MRAEIGIERRVKVTVPETPRKVPQALCESRNERAIVRPWWPEKDRVIDAGVFWTGKPLDPQQRFWLERHKLVPHILRLIERPSRAFIGWSWDEDFLRNELYPLYSEPSGSVRLRFEPQASLTFAHLSDLHVCWRKRETLEGWEIPE